MIKYLTKLKTIADFCEEFKEDVIDFQFKDGNGKRKNEPTNIYYCFTPRYEANWNVLNGIGKIIDMLGIDYLDDNADFLREQISFLNSHLTADKDFLFERYIDKMINAFRNAQDKIKDKLLLLDQIEKKRLDEAINCYVQGCNYSAVALAVSAIESRLFSLMKNKCSDAELDGFTLGQLIREYLDNPERYDNCIPKKHKHLLEHCNVYRIFSVHPKKEKITRTVSTSILSLTFGFLFDEQLKLSID